jgi:hypothetical protein
VVKRPLEEGVHRKLEEGLGEMWIFKISRTLDVVKMETRRGKFHWPFEEIRLETFRSRRTDKLWGRGKEFEERYLPVSCET